MAISKFILNNVTQMDVTDATVTASDILNGKTAYGADGTKITGTIQNGSAKTPATTITSSPTISVDASGLITATNSKTQSITPTVSAGYITSGTAGTITVSGSNTKQLTTKGATTYTPTTTNQTIASETYLTGAQTIFGDADLVAENIKKDVSIFGVTGTYEGSGGGTDFVVNLIYNSNTDRWTPDCTFSDIVSAYNANKTIATLTNVGNSDYTSTGYYDSGDDAFYYSVVDDFGYPNSEWRIGYYILYSNGVQFNGAFEYISPPTGTINITQNGTVNVTNYATADVSVSGGGLEEKDVNFIDYDGTLLYSYTAVEAQALSALPSNPSHTGLTAKGWNWTLAQIKTQLTNYPNSIVWVGQMYKTDDGKTRIYIDIPEDANNYNFTVYFAQSVARGVTVDWGDGSATQTFTGTSTSERSHGYTSSGQYVITLEVTSGTITFRGASNYSIFGSSGSSANSWKYGRITKIEFDDDAIIDGGYIFEYCYGLQEIVLPSGITSLGNSLFCDCKNLKAIVLPDTVTSIENSAFVNCINLQRVSIPYGVSSIGNTVFKGCSINSITLSNSLTSIGSSAFSTCRELKSIIVPINANPAAASSTYMFAECTKLNSIVIYGFTQLPNYFLQNCMNLKKITLPSNLTSIGNYAFSSCNYIESLTIPSGVTSIGSSSFTNCYSIKTLYCLPTTPPTLPSNTFSASDLKIVVPYSADHSVLQAYKTATNWVGYQSKMVEAEP